MHILSTLSPNGKRVAPYRLAGGVLVKRCDERHIFKAKQAVGIDEAVWQAHRSRVDVVRFEFIDGSVREIATDKFEKKSFLHGDGISFAVTRFIRLSDLQLVRGRRESPHQLPLFAITGGGL